LNQTLAIAIWKNRISPLFDASRSVLLLRIEDGKELKREQVKLEGEAPTSRADTLAARGVDVLICGAISRPFARAIESRDIRIIPFIAGDPEAIITSFLINRLEASHRMPGCAPHRRRRHRGRGGAQ